MTRDCELLQRYAETDSEEAFAELVRRHLDLVYSAALRQVNGDTHLAQDLAQTVFIDLARKAAALSSRAVLTGWLYTSTHFAAAKAVRAESRRRTREQKVHAMSTLLHDSAPDPDWKRLYPVLDQAMHQLKEADREAILLRFFEHRQHVEIGMKLGVSENTARMRVDRAVDKLRSHLVRRGLTTSAATLSAIISTHAVQAAPAGLAAALASASIAGAAAGTTTTVTLLKLMSMTKLQAAVTALVITGAATTLLMQWQSRNALRRENESLRQQRLQLSSEKDLLAQRLAQVRSMPAPRLPAPKLQAAPVLAEPSIEDLSNLYARFRDKEPRLTTDQVEAYLKASRRNSASLLAAYRTSKDRAFLEEAKKNYPHEPQVAFEAALQKDASPEERSQWLEALKNSDPENALPNYLLALDYFKAGKADQAVQELITAAGKGVYSDYTNARVQDDQEAYLAAGYSAAEAKTIPAGQLLLPQLQQVKELGVTLAELANSYRQAGDEASAQAALQMVAQLGRRYADTPGETEVSWLVGMAVEQLALSKMDPAAPYGHGDQTVLDRLNQIGRQKNELRELNEKLEPLLPQLTDLDWISLKDRWRVFGERAAIRWVVSKYEDR